MSASSREQSLYTRHPCIRSEWEQDPRPTWQVPTGDHPSEQLAFKDGWIYWSQGSTTNSGVVGRDNGGGTGQADIPCQDIVLSQNVFDSGGGVMTSGYSPFGTQRRGPR